MIKVRVTDYEVFKVQFLDLNEAFKAVQEGKLSFLSGGSLCTVTCDKVPLPCTKKIASKLNKKWSCKICPLLEDGERVLGAKSALERHYRQHFPVVLGKQCVKCKIFNHRKDRKCTKCPKLNTTKPAKKRKSDGSDAKTPVKKAK